jgi:hypothetical protein
MCKQWGPDIPPVRKCPVCKCKFNGLLCPNECWKKSQGRGAPLASRRMQCDISPALDNRLERSDNKATHNTKGIPNMHKVTRYFIARQDSLQDDCPISVIEVKNPPWQEDLLRLATWSDFYAQWPMWESECFIVNADDHCARTSAFENLCYTMASNNGKCWLFRPDGWLISKDSDPYWFIGM